ncbi:MAG: hypothetical protein AB1898_30555 [Acidobacteriota bacterium]
MAAPAERGEPVTGMSYRYSFPRSIDPESVKEALFLALLAAESLHGRPRVRLETLFSVDEREGTCLIQAGTEVGEHLARIFTGFLGQEFGSEAFSVQVVGGDDPGMGVGRDSLCTGRNQ